MSSSCGKRNREKGRKKKNYSSRNVGMAMWAQCGKKEKVVGCCCWRDWIQKFSFSLCSFQYLTNLSCSLFLEFGTCLILFGLHLVLLLKVIQNRFWNKYWLERTTKKQCLGKLKLFPVWKSKMWEGNKLHRIFGWRAVHQLALYRV